MKLADGNPMWLTLSTDKAAVFLSVHVEFEGIKQRLDFRLTHQAGTPTPDLPAVAASALKDAIQAALESRVEQVRKDEYASGYRTGRGRKALRTWTPCTLTATVFP